MRRLTITLRICAYAALTGLLFGAFMVGFFPAQASRLGSRMMADSAMTIANLFAADLGSAYSASGAGSEELVRTALRHLSGTP
jgi:hypothetical protein